MKNDFEILWQLCDDIVRYQEKNKNGMPSPLALKIIAIWGSFKVHSS